MVYTSSMDKVGNQHRTEAGTTLFREGLPSKSLQIANNSAPIEPVWGCIE